MDEDLHYINKEIEDIDWGILEIKLRMADPNHVYKMAELCIRVLKNE